jgi:predicted RNase H-like HicB family nuclease
MTYGIVFEQAPDGGVSAYLPDMPGVAVVAADQAEALAMLDKAVAWHVEGMIQDGESIPPSSTDISNYRWAFELTLDSAKHTVASASFAIK